LEVNTLTGIASVCDVLAGALEQLSSAAHSVSELRMHTRTDPVMMCIVLIPGLCKSYSLTHMHAVRPGQLMVSARRLDMVT
jgi:hypothetical protein